MTTNSIKRGKREKKTRDSEKRKKRKKKTPRLSVVLSGM
jgi:hypothetical protein